MTRLTSSTAFAVLAAVFAVPSAAQFDAPPSQSLHHGSFRYEYQDANDRFGTAMTTADFNADGYTDLAIAVPQDRYGSLLETGAVAVAPGSFQGLQPYSWPPQRQTWSGLPDIEAYDRFGWALAAGDFDRDGYADLAVGAPYEDNGGTNAGVVSVIYGYRDGLHWNKIQDLRQGKSGIDGSPESYDNFGWALAVGDFNGDRYDDLAVGVPSETLGSNIHGEGAVQVFFGGAFGLDLAGDDFIHQSEIAYGGTSEDGDEFGAALAAGDFDHDGFDDLAIGVPREDSSGRIDCGSVTVVMGGAAGLDKSRGVSLWQGGTPTLGGVESWDRFGSVLAAGDLNGDGYEEIIIGVPDEDVDILVDAGAINIIPGSPTGPTFNGALYLHQASPGVPDEAEAGDRFGKSVLVARDRLATFGNLLVGIPGENGTGAYQRFSAGPAGIAPTSGQLFFQPGFTAREAGDEYGAALAYGDFDRNGSGEVAAAAPAESIGASTNTGQVDVVYTVPVIIFDPFLGVRP